MPKYTKVVIILKDADNHELYNSRIIDFLNDRYTIINDNNYVLVLDIANESNINDFVSDGVSSLPAMKVADNDYIYGVNSIISALAQLETPPIKPKVEPYVNKHQHQEETHGFDNIIMDEMLSGLQDDDGDDVDPKNKIKPPREDFSETPLSDKMIAEKAQAYSNIYKNTPDSQSVIYKRKQAKSKIPTTPNKKLSDDDVSDSIDNSNFDMHEKAFLRNMIGV